MTLEQIKTDIKAHHDSAESERVMANNDRDFYYFSGKSSAYRTCIDVLDKLEPTDIDEVIKTLGGGIGVPADYCGSEAKSYVIGYRKALFDIRENLNKGG